MNLPLRYNLAHSPLPVRWVIAIAWILIAAKCVLIAWVVEHHHIPFGAGWIIVPTLIFSALATGTWAMRAGE